MERLRLHVRSEQEPEALSVRGILEMWVLKMVQFGLSSHRALRLVEESHNSGTFLPVIHTVTVQENRDNLKVPREWGQERH